MSSPAHKREVGRGERVVPGVWRLRLPLPWPGVPHCNAWAVAAGDGVVLFDCGMHEPGSEAHLDRAMEQVNLKVEHVRLLVCTHAHADHYGQAKTVTERSGCELWMHPNHGHMLQTANDPDAALDRRIEVARQSGVPEPALELLEQRRGQPYGIAGVVEPAKDLLPGVTVSTDLGSWEVYETPGHAPSHVCLFQPEHRILVSGDHLLGRVSLWYDYGYSPDPAGEFLRSLDLVETLDARLCLSGHGRTFTDIGAHIDANRKLVHERIEKVLGAVRGEPLAAFEVIPHVYEGALNPMTGAWWLNETLVYLTHLELQGAVERMPGEFGPVERWRAAG
ncbi:MAG: MBL fold metallo-hydrolase [Baekduia sp.]